MLEIIEKMNEFGWDNVLLCVVLFCSLIVSVKVGLDKLLSVLGLRTEASLKEEQLSNRLNQMQKDIDKLDQKIDDAVNDTYTKQEKYHQQSIDIRDGLKSAQDQIKDSLSGLEKILLKKLIEDMRWEILDFCSAVSAGRKYNKEYYDHVFEVYDDYEKILEKNDMTNGRVDSSMEFIRERYTELMEKGFDYSKDRNVG